MRKHIARAISGLSPRLYLMLSYRYNRKRWPRLDHPRDLSEKLICHMLNGGVHRYSCYADKYEVREFIREKGLEEILPQLIGVWDNASAINFDMLPAKFALKLNNGCGYNVICRDKSLIDRKLVVEQVNGWLKETYSLVETQYSLIRPRVFCEEFISDDTQDLPVDYKFMCFDGRPHSILVCTERSQKLKLHMRDLSWEPLDYLTREFAADDRLPCPPNLHRMAAIAEKLSQGFPFVRVDLYDVGGKVYFGELTFTPQKGIVSYFSDRALLEMGDLMTA